MPFPPPEMPFPPTLPSKLLVIFKAPAQHSPPLQSLPWLPYVVISPSHSSIPIREIAPDFQEITKERGATQTSGEHWYVSYM